MTLSKFIKRRSFDLILFGWVDAHRMNFPTMNTLQAVQMFADRYNLSPDEFNIETGRHTYQVMLNELQEDHKSKKE